MSGDPISISNDADVDTSATIINPHSAVQRLRHADPKIRHAALVALQASVMSQLHCSNRPVSMKVLQAVREQVSSNDLECSAVAADCLAQYLSATSNKDNSNNSNINSSEQQKQKQTTASWALVLLGRLDDCRKALAEQADASKSKTSQNQQKKAEKLRKQWYAVSAPCFIALCQLIEDNGNALDQINLQKKTFVEVVFGMLSLEITTPTTTACISSTNTKSDTAMTDATTATTTTTDPTESQQQQLAHDAIFTELRESTALYAARCLHSALDDNWELAEVLEHGDNKDAWKILLGQSTESSSHALSITTRLHLIGCLVNLYQLSLSSDETSLSSSSWQEEVLFEYGICSSTTTTRMGEEVNDHGLLLEVLLNRMNNIPTPLNIQLRNLEYNYRRAQVLLKKQQEDRELEEEVDAKVKERKEPAKLIARRQKIVKEAKREQHREKQKAKMIAEAEAAEDDTDMMDAASDNEEDIAKSSGKITNREQDGEEAVNEAMLAWTGTTGTIQLALEILTNLVSTWISGGGGDDEQMADSASASTPKPNNMLHNVITRHEAGSILTDMLQTLCQFLRKGKIDPEMVLEGKSGGKCNNYEADDPIRTDVEETIGKLSACVINCILSGITTGDAVKSVWNIILTDLNAEISSNSHTANKAVMDAYSALSVVVTETNPHILHQETDNTTLFQQYITLFQQLLPRRDAVSLLSTTVLAVVSSPQAATTTANNTEAVVRSITEVFLKLIATKVDGNASHSNDAEVNAIIVNTQTQILQTFMDWYGTDTFYPQLYNELQVSPAIVSCLASISNATKSENTNNNSAMNVIDIDEEQIEILNNSERFVEYKKQQQNL